MKKHTDLRIVVAKVDHGVLHTGNQAAVIVLGAYHPFLVVWCIFRVLLQQLL